MRRDDLKKPNTALAAAAAIAGAACFAVFIFLIAGSGSVPWDEPAAQWFYGIRSPGLTTLAEAITYLGNWYSITVLVILLLIYPKTRRDFGVPALFAAVVTQLIKIIVKSAVCRPRPDAALHLIEQGGWSFPSGHAITSIAVFGVLFLALLSSSAAEGGAKKKALLICCAFLAFAIGLTRIYLGVHYPSDVAAGWSAGIAMIGITFLLRPFTDRIADGIDRLEGRLINGRA